MILDSTSAEKLHGHNYQVGVELTFDHAKLDQNQGFFCHFGDLKKEIQFLMDAWDERVLLPGAQPEMSFREEGKSLRVLFRDREYLFPANEVIRLPIVNTSVEYLSKLLALALAAKLAAVQFETLVVRVDEAPGQGASFIFRK